MQTTFCKTWNSRFTYLLTTKWFQNIQSAEVDTAFLDDSTSILTAFESRWSQNGDYTALRSERVRDYSWEFFKVFEVIRICYWRISWKIWVIDYVTGMESMQFTRVEFEERGELEWLKLHELIALIYKPVIYTLLISNTR